MEKNITARPDGARVEFEHLEDWIRMKVQGFIQEMLEEEVELMLGRARQLMEIRVVALENASWPITSGP